MSKVFQDYIGLFYFAQWFDQKTRATLSTNQKQN